jgi:hypothetical protein
VSKFRARHLPTRLRRPSAIVLRPSSPTRMSRGNALQLATDQAAPSAPSSRPLHSTRGISKRTTGSGRSTPAEGTTNRQLSNTKQRTKSGRTTIGRSRLHFRSTRRSRIRNERRVHCVDHGALSSGIWRSTRTIPMRRIMPRVC